MRRPYCSRSLQMRQELHQAKRWTRYSTYTRRLMERGDEVKTVTFDPEQWQLVPRSSTFEMDRELVWGGDSGEEKWTAALATAPQHESQWQPIETAPKDCNIILFGRWWSDEQGWMKEPVIGRWNQKTDGRWEFANAGGWWGIRPTVWMPLPQHPDTGETTSQTVAD